MHRSPSTISNKNVYSIESIYREPNSNGYDFRFEVRENVGRCQRRRGLGENGGEGREIENVCTVRRGLAVAGSNFALFVKKQAWNVCGDRSDKMHKRESAF